MTAVPTAPVARLSPAEFFACWNSLGLDEPPLLLQVRPPGYTMAERRRIFAEAASGLSARGLYAAGRPEPALQRMLEILACPDYTLDIRYATDPRTQVLGLAAVSGASATVVVSDGTGAGPLDLLDLDSAHAAGYLISLAGPINPGRGRPVNIPVESLDEARAAVPDGDIWSVADHLRSRGVSRADASSFARMCGDIRSGGQLGATGHFGGPPRRGPWVIVFHRTPAGYFMRLQRRHGAPAAVLTVCPADAALLLRHWRELVERLATTPR